MRFLDHFSYRFHLLFHFLDLFWSYEDPILKLIPTQRCLTWSPVKKLKRHHLNGALIVVVVCKLYQWQELFPKLFLVYHVHMQNILQDLVLSFCLPVCLWVIFGSQGLLETTPKSSRKHRSMIGYGPFRHTMQSQYLTDKKSSYV